ncbi:hypothetical protein [Sporosarcina ureae]|uniref:hypothetical protein n=1 Tax=Sporosarcina ureae TaxID=1571 RepID=UPI0026F128FE|nr:hypothetical protein [Sporosarcina ureae]
MQLPRNEKGYALVIVLLVIIIIMIVSTVFMRGSISNVKQERIVDENNLAYTAAEMGLDYYKWLYLNKFKAVRDGVWQEKKSAFENDVIAIKKKKLSSIQEENEIKNAARNRQEQMIDLLVTKHFFKLEETKPNTTDSLNYLIQIPIEYKKVENSDGLVVALIVQGIVMGKYGMEVERIKNLDFKLFFDFPLLSSALSPDIPYSNDGIPIVNIKDAIKNNIQTKKCSEKPINEKCLSNGASESHFTALNSIVYFPNGYEKENGNIGIDFKNTQIYSEEEIELPNMNNMKNITMYVKGDIEIKNVNGANNANLYATENIEFKNASSAYSNSVLYAEKDIEGKNVEFNNMRIFVGGDYSGDKFTLSAKSYMVVEGELEIEKSGSILNSNLIVKGDLDVDKSLEVKNGSKVCVGGEIDFNKINIKSLDSSSVIYFIQEKAEPKNIIGKYPNLVSIKESEFKKNPDVLFKNCLRGGNGSSNPGSFEKPHWETPEIDVEYN